MNKIETKKALITGITGQDGSYLAELLLKKGYEVHGLIRRVAAENGDQRLSRIFHIKDKIHLHPGTLESHGRILEIFDEIKPNECYHLASQSFVQESFEDCFTTFNTNINGTHHVLSALKRKSPNCKFYFAATSEMFGKVKETPQNENTKFHPRSPYGISKVAGFDLTRNYREAYNIFGCSGILFNHESPRRGFEFVTRKITKTIAEIKSGFTNLLVLGDLNAKRDWGYAGDYVEAMWAMLQQEKPDDYVIATGENRTIKELIDSAFKCVNLDYEIVDLHEKTPDEADKEIEKLKQQKNKIFVIQHPRFYRPAEVYELRGDSTKARQILGWKPKVSFNELVEMMVKNDMGIIKKTNETSNTM